MRDVAFQRAISDIDCGQPSMVSLLAQQWSRVMNCFWRRISGCLLLLLLAGGCSRSGSPVAQEKIAGHPSDPPVVLMPKWQGSNKYIYRFETTVRADFPRTKPDQTVRQETILGHDYAVTVNNAGSTNGVLDLEILNVQLDMSLGDRVLVTYDSENKVMEVPDSSRIQRVRNLIGARIRYEITPSGSVKSVHGVEELIGKMFSSEDQRISDGLFRRILNTHYFRQLVEHVALPNGSVKIGNTWIVRREFNSPLSGPVALTLNCRLRGWQKHLERQCALIEFKGDLRAATNAAPDAQKRDQQRGIGGMLEEGTISGKTWFDLSAAIAVHTITDQALTFRNSLSRRLRAADPSAQRVTTKIKQHTEFQLLETVPVQSTEIAERREPTK